MERFARNERIFPGGEHPTGNCTGCARVITERFGGEVPGYYHDDNPSARIGEVEGGHDFAVTPDRFLVDPWLYHYYGEALVLDLAVPAEQTEALARYGPADRWERLPEQPQLAVRPGAARALGKRTGRTRPAPPV